MIKQCLKKNRKVNVKEMLQHLNHNKFKLNTIFIYYHI